MLPRVELPEVILEVMSWAPQLVASFTAVSGGRSRLEDLPTSVAACLSVPLLLEGPPQTGSLISPSLALLGAGGVPYAAKERALVGGASTHET
jgi:hypothetical protein